MLYHQTRELLTIDQNDVLLRRIITRGLAEFRSGDEQTLAIATRDGARERLYPRAADGVIGGIMLDLDVNQILTVTQIGDR